MASKAGLEIHSDLLESHYLARGNVLRVVQALIAADKANIALDFKRAAAIDLAGRHVLEAVQMSVNPKVVDTPRVAGVAKDGIQLTAIARVTVRANIDRLVGGEARERKPSWPASARVSSRRSDPPSRTNRCLKSPT